MTCLSPIFDLHKLPCRKPVRQQRFDNYPSIMYTRMFNPKNGDMNFQENRQTSDEHVRNKCEQVVEQMPRLLEQMPSPISHDTSKYLNQSKEFKDHLSSYRRNNLDKYRRISVGTTDT